MGMGMRAKKYGVSYQDSKIRNVLKLDVLEHGVGCTTL